MPNSRENDPEPDDQRNSGNGERRPYNSPRVLSAERLEAAAATCDPPVLPFGKNTAPGFGNCTTLGS